MRERGSALLTAVIMVMVFLLIAGIFFAVVNYQFKLETSEEKGLKAYYLAEAGIAKGISKVRLNPEGFAWPVTTGVYEDINPFGANYSGIIDYQIETFESTTRYTFTVTSTAYYPDKQGIKRVLQEQYTFPRP